MQDLAVTQTRSQALILGLIMVHHEHKKSTGLRFYVKLGEPGRYGQYCGFDHGGAMSRGGTHLLTFPLQAA